MPSTLYGCHSELGGKPSEEPAVMLERGYRGSL